MEIKFANLTILTKHIPLVIHLKIPQLGWACHMPHPGTSRKWRLEPVTNKGPWTVTLSSFGSVEMSLHSGMMFALVIPDNEPDSYCSSSDKPLKPFGKGLAVLETASSAIRCPTYLLFSLTAVTSLWQSWNPRHARWSLPRWWKLWWWISAPVLENNNYCHLNPSSFLD